jgi:hypothetical protein
MVVCQKPTATPVSFGGTFQLDDPGAYGCRAANPNTGACSCPAGFVAQPNRVIVDGPHGSHFFTCVPPLPNVQICPAQGAYPAQFASPAGGVDATAALQTCINGTPDGGAVQLPAGNYRVEYALQLKSNMTVRTQGLVDSNPARCLSDTHCAALLASPSFYSINGVIQALGTTAAKLDHIIVDGNRSFRMQSANANLCRAGQNRYGFNVTFSSCTSCEFTNSGSVSALCGTGMEWLGDNAKIQNSTFMGNGDSTVFADGLTLLQSNGAQVIGNRFFENTDIGFIFGGGNSATVSGNHVQNVDPARFAFAGMMLDNFGGGTSGSFWWTVVSGNYINCPRCSFAFNAGPRPWYAGTIYGGTIASNTISGGHISLNIDGAGADPYSGVTVVNNAIGPTVNHNIQCMASTDFNLAPGSWLHPASNNWPTAYFSTAGCHK